MRRRSSITSPHSTRGSRRRTKASSAAGDDQPGSERPDLAEQRLDGAPIEGGRRVVGFPPLVADGSNGLSARASFGARRVLGAARPVASPRVDAPTLGLARLLDRDRDPPLF